MQEIVSDFEPSVVVMDPVSDILHVAGGDEASALLTRQIDYLKSGGVTALFTSLATTEAERESQRVGSLMDTWIVATLSVGEEERTRVLYVLKSRGMAHSHDIREYVIDSTGISVTGMFHAPAVRA
jgi:circadian clock protein KaiC